MTDEIMEHVKRLLPDADETLLAFTVALAENCILNYCHVDQTPRGLYHVAAVMALDAWQQSAFGREQLEAQMKGITRGDTSFSFAAPFEQVRAAIQNPGFTRQYRAQLDAYRKLRW